MPARPATTVAAGAFAVPRTPADLTLPACPPLARASATASSRSAGPVATRVGLTRCAACPSPCASLADHPPQCTWGRETAKKARTQQHFESLVNHIKSLETRVKELEAELARSRAQRSGSISDATPSAAGSSSLSPRPSPIAKYEPDDDDRLPDDDDDDEPRNSDQDSEIEQLIAPTRHLVVRLPVNLSPVRL